MLNQSVSLKQFIEQTLIDISDGVSSAHQKRPFLSKPIVNSPKNHDFSVINFTGLFCILISF